jgi:hypothetical protein
MPSIDGFEIPEDIVDDLKTLVDVMDDDLLLEYVRYDQEIARGYQPKRKNARTFRSRMKKKLAKPIPLDPPICGALALAGLNGELVHQLSLAVLAKHAENLITIHGKSVMIPGLLVDAREEVRALAIDWLQNRGEDKDEPAEEDRTKALVAFLQDCAPLLDAVQDLVEEQGLAVEPDDDELDEEDEDWEADLQLLKKPFAELEKARQRVTRLEAELKEARSQGKAVKKLRQSAARQNERLQKLDKELRQEKKHVKQQAAELKRAHADVVKLEAETEKRVREGVERELSSRLRAWLKKPMAVEADAQAAGADTKRGTLLDRVRAALERQAERDRHSGNVRRLRDRLQQLRQSLAEVRKAREEALQPLPDLPDLCKELEREIENTREILGDTRELSPFASGLLSRINEAGTLADLEALQGLLNELTDQQALDGRQLRTLYTACHNRLARMYEAFTPKVTRKKHPRGPAWRFRQALRANEAFIWTLDGHNVLFGLDDLFGYDPETGAPGQKARDALVTAMKAFVDEAPKCEVTVFFDSPEHGEHRASKNVKVIFSGGEGEHRADRAILSYLEYVCREMSAMPRVLVTNDRDLARQARELNTDIMRLEEFAALLQEADTGRSAASDQ